MQKHNKTHIQRNKLRILQTKKNGILNTKNTEKLSINTVFDFFNIAANNREYFKNAIFDGIGLYSLVHWRGPKHYTYDNLTNSIIQVDTDISNTNGTKLIKAKPLYIEGSIQKSSITNKEYIYMGTFFISETDYIGQKVNLKCDILKNKIDNNYIINFKWGVRTNLMNNKMSHALDKMCDFLTQKLLSTDWNNNNILLIGYSMGGNVAQHIALRLLNSKYKHYLYLLSLGIGGTLNTFSIKKRIESGLDKRFISIAILNSNTEYHTHYLPTKYNLNIYILPDKNTKTIKTLILHTTINHNPNINTDITYTIKGYYNFDKFFAKTYYNKKVKNKLHELIYYRALLKMLIDAIN